MGSIGDALGPCGVRKALKMTLRWHSWDIAKTIEFLGFCRFLEVWGSPDGGFGVHLEELVVPFRRSPEMTFPAIAGMAPQVEITDLGGGKVGLLGSSKQIPDR